MALFSSKRLFLLISILALWLNFSSNMISTLSIDKFLDNDFPSERYVFSRLIHNIENNAGTDGGLLIAYDNVDMLKGADRDAYGEYRKKLIDQQDNSYSVYHSHAGLQDNLIMPLWSALEWVKAKVLDTAREGSRWHKRLQTLDHYYYKIITQYVIALINAITISFILFWAARQFSLPHAWVALGLMLVTLPALTFFGRSMWWMLWSWFLPMLITLWGLRHNKGKPPTIMLSTIIGALTGGAVCVKALMGYEFISTIMVAAMIPIIFYALYNEWSFKDWFRTSIIIGICATAGVLGAFISHVEALKAITDDPMKLIMSTLDSRAHGGINPERFGGEITKSVESSVLMLVGDYLISPKELAIPQILFTAPFLLWLRKQNWKKMLPKYRALTASIAIGFIGAISMLVILKGHAYIHGYDIVIWAIPMNIFVLIFYADQILASKK